MQGSGIIPFAQSPQGIGRQVLAKHVDTIDKLPLGDPSKLIETLTENSLPPELRRHASHLLGYHRGIRHNTAKPVNSRYVHMLIAGHSPAGAPQLRHQRILRHNMTG